MKIINFQVELLPNSEVIVNGRSLNNSCAEIDEKVLTKRVSLEQQWRLMCEVHKLLNRMVDNYNKGRVRAGEINHEEYDRARIISAGSGIPGVVAPLPKGKFTGRTL